MTKTKNTGACPDRAVLRKDADVPPFTAETLTAETVARLARFCAEGKGAITISRGGIVPSWTAEASCKVVHHYVSGADTETLETHARGYAEHLDRVTNEGAIQIASPLDAAINKAISACERAAKALGK